MGTRKKKKDIATNNHRAIAQLTRGLRELAGFVRMNAIAQQAVVKAVVQHLGIEPQVREIVQRFEDEARAAAEQKVDTVTPEELAEPISDTEVTE